LSIVHNLSHGYEYRTRHPLVHYYTTDCAISVVYGNKKFRYSGEHSASDLVPIESSYATSY